MIEMFRVTQNVKQSHNTYKCDVERSRLVYRRHEQSNVDLSYYHQQKRFDGLLSV